MSATTTPPHEEAEEVATVSRKREDLGIPPFSTVARPGSGSVFGRGFFRRLRALGGSAVVHLVLVAAGLAVLLYGLAGTAGPYKEALREDLEPRTFLTILAFGTVFFLLALRALQVALNRVRVAREAPERPRAKGARKEPWTWDHPWSASWMAPVGESVDNSILGRVTFFAFVALFNGAWLSGEPFFYVFLPLLDLLALYVLYRILRKGVQSVRFRRPVVIWEEIPTYVGKQLQGRIAFPRDVRATGPTRLTLRCVTEDGKRGPYGETLADSDVFAIYRETREIPLPGAPGEPLDVLSFSFKIPYDLPGNSLLKKDPVYWQVVANVPVSGPDLEVAFLAPVYQKL